MKKFLIKFGTPTILIIILVGSIVNRHSLRGHGIMAYLYWLAVVGACALYLAYLIQRIKKDIK